MSNISTAISQSSQSEWTWITSFSNKLLLTHLVASFPGPTQWFFIHVWGEPGIEATFLALSINTDLCTIHIWHNITMVTRMSLNSWHSRAYYSSTHSEPILWSWWRGMGKSLLWSGLWWSPLTPAAPSGRQTPLHSTSHRSRGFTSLVHVCLTQIICIFTQIVVSPHPHCVL